MALTPGTFEIGPETGSLRLRTKREGVAAKVGHDLLIELPAWSGTVEIAGEDPASATVHVEIEMASLTIVEGTGGVAALSNDDRKDITGTAMKLLDVAGHPKAKFTSTAITGTDTGGMIEGTLELRGQTATVQLEVSSSGPSTWTAAGSLLQSEFGIKPYRAFFGALRLADPVAIEADVRRPA